jgi:hypothetical protein
LPRPRNKPDFGGSSKRRVAQDIVKTLPTSHRPQGQNQLRLKKADKYGASMAAAADRLRVARINVARQRPCNFALIGFRINAALFRADA